NQLNWYIRRQRNGFGRGHECNPTAVPGQDSARSADKGKHWPAGTAPALLANYGVADTVGLSDAPAVAALEPCCDTAALSRLRCLPRFRITNSTRRFCCRPEAVLLDATGSASPWPSMVMRLRSIPRAVMASATDCARRSDRR